MRKVVKSGFMPWPIEYGTHASNHMKSSGSPDVPTDKYVGLPQAELKSATARNMYRTSAQNDGMTFSLFVRSLTEREIRALMNVEEV